MIVVFVHVIRIGAWLIIVVPLFVVVGLVRLIRVVVITIIVIAIIVVAVIVV